MDDNETVLQLIEDEICLPLADDDHSHWAMITMITTSQEPTCPRKLESLPCLHFGEVLSKKDRPQAVGVMVKSPE